VRKIMTERKEKRDSAKGEKRDEESTPFVLYCEGAVQLVQSSAEQAFSEYGFRMRSSMFSEEMRGGEERRRGKRGEKRRGGQRRREGRKVTREEGEGAER
jgi:hypothetical protein